MEMKKIRRVLWVSMLLTGFFTTQAQDMLVATKVSPRASVTQRIGTTDVTIVYHSPAAKKRKIFGGIVPYDFTVDGIEYPWRAGSNQNTTIDFTHDVTIEGKPLPKGTYGLHVYVSEKEWIFIFSKNSESWGSFGYDPKDDALRVRVRPEEHVYQEWLNYEFVTRQADKAKLELQWSTLKCGIEITTDVNKNVLTDLLAKEEKTNDDYIKIAQLMATGEAADLNKALEYVEKSLEEAEGFRSLMLKADLLARKGNKAESIATQEKAIALGKGFPYYYYYPLSFMLLENDKERTFSTLSAMLEENPDNWIANLAMGEYYIKEQNQEKATFHFGKAYEFAGERSKNYTRYMYLSNKLILERM